MARTFFWSVMALVGFGIFALTTASSSYSYNHFGSIFYLTIKQLVALGIGVVVFFIATKIPVRWYWKNTVFLYGGALLLLLMVYIPSLGFSHGGATRWVSIGSFTLQPVEIVKILFVLIVAATAISKKTVMNRFKQGIMRLFIIASPFFILLALQPDLDGLFLVLLSFFLIAFLHHCSIKHVLLLCFGGIAVFGLLFIIYPERLTRLQVFLSDRGDDPLRSEYHITQALRAVSSGGWFGVGFGKGLIHNGGSLPEAYSDSIFAVIVEEFGFVGALFLISLYVFIATVGIIGVSRSSDEYGRIVGVTVLVLFLVQAYLNIAANVSLVPFTGLTLPLVGYGGSSLVAYLFGMGIVYRVIRNQ